ncbi:hypothetical protein HDV05_007183, partial [Chytridiales sp. JEL 0842]
MSLMALGSTAAQALKGSSKNITIALLVIASSTFFVKLRQFYKDRERMAHIPGPTPLPFLGDILLIRKYLANRKGHELRDYMRTTYGKISKLNVRGMDILSVCDANAAKQVLNSDQFVRSDSFSKIATGLFKYALFILPTSPVWKKHRKFIQPGFGPAHLRHAVDATNQVMDTLCTIWDGKFDSAESPTSSVEINMFQVASSITIDVIGHVAFSFSYDSVLHYENPARQESLKAYNRTFEIMVERSGIPRYLWNLLNIGESYARKETQTLRDTIMTTINSKRANMKGNADVIDGRTAEGMSRLDVLDRLLEVDWTDEEIVDEVIALFLAGGETSANTITFIFWLLDQHPQALSKVQEELDRVLGANDHTHPPANITWDELSELKYTEQ